MTPILPNGRESNQTSISVSGYKRRARATVRGKNTDLGDLPRVQIVHDLSTHEKTCGCCQSELVLMGKDLASKLEVLPLRLYVAEHITLKYSCRLCDTLVTAKKEKSAIPKAIAGDSLIVEIIENKYQHHLPLYRQSLMLASYNAPIPDNTLGN